MKKSENGETVTVNGRRTYAQAFKEEAVQMVLDGHSPESVAKNLGLKHVSLLYRWKSKILGKQGQSVIELEKRIQELEEKLRRTERERDILKKNSLYFQPKSLKEIQPVIARLHQEGYSISELCKALEINRSMYYFLQRNSTGIRTQEDHRLKPKIRESFRFHKKRYGARRLVKDLEKEGELCGRKRARRLMKEMGLQAIQPKSFRPQTTQSKHTLGYSPNLFETAPFPTAPNQIWFGDITYIPLKIGGFLYLALLLDFYSRRVVGWALEDFLKELLVLKALLPKAIKERSARAWFASATPTEAPNTRALRIVRFFCGRV